MCCTTLLSLVEVVKDVRSTFGAFSEIDIIQILTFSLIDIYDT